MGTEDQHIDGLKERPMTKPILWGQENCGPCKQIARKYDTSGVDYEYRDVQDPQWQDQVTQLKEQGGSVAKIGGSQR